MAKTTEPLADAGDQTEDEDGKNLFDPAQYDSPELVLPEIDGHGVNKILAKLGGREWLDRGSAEHVALIRDVELGQELDLHVRVKVGPPIPGYTTGRDGDLDVLYLGRNFRLVSILGRA